jgi:hypothetical protein
MLLQRRLVNESNIAKDNDSATHIDFYEFKLKQRIGQFGNEKLIYDSQMQVPVNPLPILIRLCREFQNLGASPEGSTPSVWPCSFIQDQYPFSKAIFQASAFPRSSKSRYFEIPLAICSSEAKQRLL